MVATNLDVYCDAKDKNSVRIGDWAHQVQPRVASSKTCLPVCTVKFVMGRGDLFKHSESVKHQRYAQTNKHSKQTDIKDILSSSGNKEKEAVLKKTKDFEIALVQFLARYHIPPSNAECLTVILNKFVTESDIINKMKLGREKARYLTEYGIGEYYEEITHRKLKNCDTFSVGIDESEVNKKSELEMIVNVVTNNGIENLHYKSWFGAVLV